MTQRLFILSPETVFAARVNQADFAYDLTAVTFDTVTTGAYTAVKAGMTALFGSSAGADDLGRQRIRLAASSTQIFIGRSSQGVRDGEVNLSDNMYITVLDDYRVWAKIPDIDDDGNAVKDELTYTDQTSQIPPKANIIGGARAETVFGSNITVELDGTDSYAVANGATISSYLWDVDDGTITVGTAASSSITATFPAGFRWVSLKVTDSNGKEHTTRVPVYARDAASGDGLDFQCVEHTVTRAGQTCAFRILEDIDIADYPDGTLVIFWDGEPASNSDYSNVRFWGWHQTDENGLTTDRRATLRYSTLHCVDVAGRLDTLPGFPESVERNATPSSWYEMVGLNMDLYLDYLLRWHSTAFENAYFTPSGTGSSYPMVVIGSDGESLFDQCARRAKSLVPDYILTCDRNGQMRVIVDPMLQDTADRTSTSQVTIDEGDLTAVNWERMRPPRFHWLWGEAVLASATDIAAVFCRAPGVAPGQGETSTNQGEQLTQSQTDLNSCEGHRYARSNAVIGLVPVSISGYPSIEPADMTWVTLTLADTSTRRQLGFSADRGLPVELNIFYDYQRGAVVTSAELLWEQETSGTPAVTYIPPDVDWDPPWEPPPNPFPTPTPTGGGDGLGTVYVMFQLNLIRTRNLSAASPSWTAIKTVVSDAFYDWILDPFDPIHNGFLLTSDGVFRSQDLDQASPSFSQVLSLAQMNTLASPSGVLKQFYKIQGCIKKADFFAFAAWDDNGGTNCNVFMFVTEDGGDNWAVYTVYATSGGGSSTRSVYWGAMDIAQAELGGGGGPIMGVACGIGTSCRYLHSEDGGQTWSTKATAFNPSYNLTALHFPYNANSDSTKIIVSCWTGGGITYGYYISTDQGVTWTGVSGGDLGPNVIVDFNRNPIETWTPDYKEVYAFGLGSAGGKLRGFYRSSDFGLSWSRISDFAAAARGAGGFPYNGNQFYVLTGSFIYLSLDGGVSWIDKTGDWTGPRDTVGTCGGVIVPLWVEET